MMDPAGCSLTEESRAWVMTLDFTENRELENTKLTYSKSLEKKI